MFILASKNKVVTVERTTVILHIARIFIFIFIYDGFGNYCKLRRCFVKTDIPLGFGYGMCFCVLSLYLQHYSLSLKPGSLALRIHC